MNGNTAAPASASTTAQEQDSEAPGFFQEDNGNYSSMRLMSMVALIAAIVFGFLTILGPGGSNNAANTNGIYITFGFLISAFAPKAVQKFAEQKIPVVGDK
jgi:hypothetical protein